jgi:hypothetical protein
LTAAETIQRISNRIVDLLNEETEKAAIGELFGGQLATLLNTMRVMEKEWPGTLPTAFLSLKEAAHECLERLQVTLQEAPTPRD